MENPDQAIIQAQTVKQKYEAELLSKKNVVGVGVGFRHIQGQLTDTIAIVVNVEKKVRVKDLAPKDLVPKMLDGVSVDVVEVGHIRAL